MTSLCLNKIKIRKVGRASTTSCKEKYNGESPHISHSYTTSDEDAKSGVYLAVGTRIIYSLFRSLMLGLSYFSMASQLLSFLCLPSFVSLTGFFAPRLSPLSVAQSRKPFQLDYLPLSYVVLGRRSKSSGLWVKLARSTSGCTSLMDKRVMLFLSRDKSRLLFEPLVDSSDNSLSWLYASSCSFDKPTLAGSCALLGLTFGLGRTLRKI